MIRPGYQPRYINVITKTWLTHLPNNNKIENIYTEKPDKLCM